MLKGTEKLHMTPKLIWVGTGYRGELCKEEMGGY